MYTKKSLVAALSGLALANAQSEATANPTIPAIPTSTADIPTIEGALVYDGPPVIGYTGPGGNATVQSGLPAATYLATFPTTQFDPNTGTLISGSIQASSVQGGTGVSFSINLSGIPDIATYGPIVYHIHELPVPADGNCTATMAHLDPTQRGELHSCEAPAPQTCQAGDLAGKHGNITASTWTVQYSDNFLSTVPGSPYFLGDKSVVIHTSNATRITCANFVLQNGNGTSSGSNSTGSGSGSGSNATATVTVPTPSVTPFEGAAAKAFASAGVMGAAIAFVALFL